MQPRPTRPHRVASRKTDRCSQRRRLLWLIPLILGLAGAAAAGPIPDPRFIHLQIEDGLSQTTVNCVVQDPRGFMWFGTQEGLDRYDGHNMVTFAPDPDDPGSISHNYISALRVDRLGRLWVGTADGLSLYDRRTRSFTNYGLSHQPDGERSAYPITAIAADSTGALWLGSQGHGLYRFDPASGRFTPFRHDPADTTSLSGDFVNAVAQDKAGRIWIGTDQGLDWFDAPGNGFRHFRNLATARPTATDSPVATILSLLPAADGSLWVGTDEALHNLTAQPADNRAFFHDPTDPASLAPGGIAAMTTAGPHHLWLGSNQSGLDYFDVRTGRCQHIRHSRSEAHSLADDRILSLCSDRSSVLWVGTYSRGVDRYDRWSNLFTPAHSAPTIKDGSIDYVRAFLVDDRGDFWVGTDGIGVTRQDGTTGRFSHYMPDPNDAGALATDQVFSFGADGDGNVWLGGAGGVLMRYDRTRDAFESFRPPLPADTSVTPYTIRAIHAGPDGMLWLGIDGGGVFRFDPRRHTFSRPAVSGDGADALANGRIFDIMTDRRKNLWVNAFGFGVIEIAAGSGQLTCYRQGKGDHGLDNDQVMPLLEGRQGRIWIGTNGGGLVRLDPDTGVLTHFRAEIGLPSNAIYGLLADDDGQIWMSHNKGLTRFDPATLSCRNFIKADGLQSDEFNGCAAYRSAAGELFFGGIDGYNRFRPADIRSNPHVPPVVLTDLLLFNQSVPIGPDDTGHVVLHQAISETPSLNLRHEDQALTFEYTALFYGAANPIQFAYRLQGVDPDWNYVGRRRFASYQNLQPGHYTFEVKSTNAAGQWSTEGVTLPVTITPAYWQTPWFRSLCTLAAALLIWLVINYRTRLVRIRAQELEQRVRQRTLALETEIAERKAVQKALAAAHRQAVAATEAKSTFLATMSHEIRTPMNGVIGMAQLLLDSPDLSGEDREQVQTIGSSGEALLTIINDILDFSKIEAGRMELETAPFDLPTVCAELTELLAPTAFGKGLELLCRYRPGTPQRWLGDIGRIRQVILNLVGNAIKFTASGEVALEVEAAPDGGVRVAVRDTGIGLSAEQSRHLFQPFSQADSSTTRRFGGTGLGLAISKKLVELMGGRIGLESRLGTGSTFWFTLPLAPDPAAGSPAPADLSGMRILVVEPQPSGADILTEQLTAWGGRPSVIAGEDEGLGQLRAAGRAGHPFALAIVSRRPAQADGEAIAAAIRQDPATRSTKVILLCPPNPPQTDAELAAQGFAGMLLKPVRPAKLRGAIARLGESHPTSDPPRFLNSRNLAARRTGPRPAATPAPGNTASAPVPTRHVLVAEDNLVNQRVAKRMLEKNGCRVDLAVNGTEAVRLWTDSRYDIIFMDCRMPEMDGYTATGTIRSREPADSHTPIVAMTANAMEGDRELCLAAGMDDYLSKPLRQEACRQALDRWAPAAVDTPVPVP